MHRNDLIANLIKKHIRPNSNELLSPTNDNHPPSNAWRRVATYADDIVIAQSRGESFEHSMTLLNQQLEEAKYRHWEELYSNRSKERATARDKTYKEMVAEREAAEKAAAEREAAEREAAEREAAEREAAEREAARKRQATSRIARLASYLAGKTRAEAEAEATTQNTVVPQGYKFKKGDRVQCRSIYSKLGWEYGTVMTVNPLTVKSDKRYGVEGFEGKWDEVRPVPPSIMSRLKTAFNRPKIGSVRVGGKRKQTRKRRKS